MKGLQPHKSAFKLPDMGLDFARNVERNVVGKFEVLELSLLLEDCNFGFQIRRLNVGDQTRPKARLQTLLNVRNLVRQTIAGKHDLLLGVVKVVESVKELFLSCLFPRDELNIIDHEYVDIAIFLA